MSTSFSYFSFTLIWGLSVMILCVIIFLSQYFSRQRFWFQLRLKTLFQRFKLFPMPKEWLPEPSWLSWLKKLRATIKSGHSLSSALQNYPPPRFSPTRGAPLQTQLEAWKKKAAPSGWEQTTFDLLTLSHERGVSVLALTEPLLRFLDSWKVQMDEIKIQLRPIRMQLLACGTCPILVFLCIQGLYSDLSWNPTLLQLAVGLFILGSLWMLAETASLKRFLLGNPGCTHATGALYVLLFPPLIRLGVLSGASPEVSFGRALAILGFELGEPLSASRLKLSQRPLPETMTWINEQQWGELREGLRICLEQGASAGEVLTALEDLWFEEWKLRCQLRLKTQSSRMLLPLCTCFLPASLSLALNPLLQNALTS